LLVCFFAKENTNETLEAIKNRSLTAPRIALQATDKQNKNKQKDKTILGDVSFQGKVGRKQRRGNGRVIELVRNVLIHFMKQIEIDYDNFIILDELKNFLVRMQMYFWLILPENSIAMLEQCLLSILCKRMKMLPLFYVAI